MNLLKKNKFNKIQFLKLFLLICTIIILMGLSIKLRERPGHNHVVKVLNKEQKSTILNLFDTKIIKGVLDRYEKNLAVILLEEMDKEIIILKENLPKDSSEGTWFSIHVSPIGYKILGIDQKMTKEKQEKSLNLLQQLQRKSSSNDF